MKSSLNSCQSKSKLAKRTEPAWFVFVRAGSPPGYIPGMYLETMKTGEELTWIHLNTPSHFPNLFLTALEPSASMWLTGSCGRATPMVTIRCRVLGAKHAYAAIYLLRIQSYSRESVDRYSRVEKRSKPSYERFWYI
jgi:hypothetical protein